jgi:hypothetical protein
VEELPESTKHSKKIPKCILESTIFSTISFLEKKRRGILCLLPKSGWAVKASTLQE